MLFSLCGPRPHTHPDLLLDAVKARDPTKTSRLRTRMRADLDRRWHLFSQTLRQALIDQDLLGMRGMTKLPHADKTEGFGAWVAAELRHKVLGFDGSWMDPYVRQAAAIAQKHADEKLLVRDAFDPDQERDDHGRWTSSGAAFGTDEFKNWFGGSKIVNGQGQPLTMYHGTPHEFEEFGSHGEGFPSGGYWFTQSPRAAGNYAASTEKPGARVIPVFLRLENPKEIKEGSSEHERVSGLHEEIANELKSQGYDGIVVRRGYAVRGGELPGDRKGDISEAAVFSKTQIKSAISNTGKFSREKAGIRDAIVDPDRIVMMQALALSELQGIVAVAQQQLTRVITQCLMTNDTPHCSANKASSVIRAMRLRTRAMSEFIIAKTHATSTLSAFRSAGITHVGIIPEQLRKPRIVKDRDVRAEEEDDVDLRHELLVEAGLEEVEVLNGPNPCPVCEEISDNGPYDLDTAEGLIPAHAFCQCAFVPAEDRRFASVHDFDPDQPRDYHGRWAAAGEAAGVPGNDPSDPHNTRVSTRVPTEKVRKGEGKGTQLVNVHADPNVLQVGVESSKGDAVNFTKNMNIVRSYDFLKLDKKDSDETVATKFVEFAKSNILALYDKTDKAVRDLSKLWYDGAHTYADKLGADHGVPLRAAAGVIAALSPQKDWDMNADMARRVMDMWQNRKTEKFTDQTEAYAKKYLAGLKKSADEADTAEKKASRTADWKQMTEWAKEFKGKSLGDFDNAEGRKQATLMRWIDEGKNLADPSKANYTVFSPNGATSDVARNLPTKKEREAGQPGKPSKIAWQTYDAIDNAISALKNPSREGISEALGEMHKVRNFYNNIMHPNDPAGDITVDTHAIAAALMHPVAGKDKMTAQGLGGAGSKSVKTGAKGLYGLYAEAYRQAAIDRGILPRQMQSIVWESIRGVWSSSDKSDPKEVARVKDVWKDYQHGRIDQRAAQERVLENGIDDPVWFSRGHPGHDSRRLSLDEDDVQDFELPGYRTGGLDSRDAGDDPGDPAGLTDYAPDQPRDPQGRFTEVSGGASYEFVSPNISQIGLSEAVKGIASNRQRILHEASQEIDNGLNLQSRNLDAIGAWADGAENSTVSIISGDQSWDKIAASAAMKGYLADQKAVLAFKQRDGERAALYHFEASERDAQKLHDNLSADGLAFHTIVPTTNGHEVYVADLDGSAHKAVAKAAERYDAPVDYQLGHAEFIGTTKEDGTDREQRDDARRAYERFIQQSTVSGSQEVWARVRDYWSKTLDLTRDFDPDQPRDPSGRWASGVDRPPNRGEDDKVEISGNKFSVYHGTSEAAIEDIKKFGLKPHGSAGADQWAAAQGAKAEAIAMTAGDRKFNVYFATDPYKALQFAMLAAEVRESVPAILKIDLPMSEAPKVKADEYGEAGMLKYRGEIRPEYITVGKLPKEVIEAAKAVNFKPHIEHFKKDADAFTIYAVVFEDATPTED